MQQREYAALFVALPYYSIFTLSPSIPLPLQLPPLKELFGSLFGVLLRRLLRRGSLCALSIYHFNLFAFVLLHELLEALFDPYSSSIIMAIAISLPSHALIGSSPSCHTI